MDDEWRMETGTSADVPDLILLGHAAESQVVVVLLLALLTRVQQEGGMAGVDEVQCWNAWGWFTDVLSLLLGFILLGCCSSLHWRGLSY
jgi:hypothetical protein